MSAEKVDSDTAAVICASCGIAEVDEIKLTKCDSCDLVRYCSDTCQQDHLPHHEAMCKERAVELRDEILFRQPESSHLGDCPICCLPLSIEMKGSLFYSCCSTMICNGCEFANQKRQSEERLDHTCPFCRKLLPKTQEECNANYMTRVEGNDPVAMAEVGRMHGQMGNIAVAIVFSTKAAALGDVNAHHKLGFTYLRGGGVEKDKERGLHHLEEAAIGGHPRARYNLGCCEWENSRFDRAVKHFIIAANLGDDESIQQLKNCYKDGLVSKEGFAAALRAHQAAVNETKSRQREEASKAWQRQKPREQKK